MMKPNRQKSETPGSGRAFQRNTRKIDQGHCTARPEDALASACQNLVAKAIDQTGLAALLLSRLEGVRPAGPGRWYARCPAHQDKAPSLSIRDAGDRVLLHCFTGCDPTDILTAVGLVWKDLYPDRWECAAKRPNEAAAKYARRTLAATDPLDLERLVLRIAAADRRAGRPVTVEDRARAEIAVERLRAAGGSNGR